MKIITLLVLFCILALPSSESCSRNTKQLTPELQNKLTQLKGLANERGIDFKIICTYRSQKEQDILYRRGRTNKGNKVTWTKTSRHSRGTAVDIAIIKGSKISWKGTDYIDLGKIGKTLGLTWGGDWKVRDYGHFEI